MKILFIAIALSCILFISCSTANEKTVKPPQSFQSISAVSAAGFSADRLAVLDSFIYAKITDGTLPHMVTFIARGGKIVHNKSYGEMAQGKNMSTDAIFRIASQTKAIVSTGLMKLYERGYFLLDDPVSKYIPSFADPEILLEYKQEDSTYTTKSAEGEITVRQLLTHTAGIPYGHPIYLQKKVPMLNTLENQTLADVIPGVGELPIMHEPGEKFTYGINTDIIGYLIEVLSGKSLDEYLQEEIFTPLGMIDTYFYLPEDKHERLVSLYTKPSADAELQLSEHPSNTVYPVDGYQTYFSGGAGLVGTIQDYARFCQMLLNGGEFNGNRILAPKTIEMMTRNQIGDLEVWNRQNKFGLGFEIITEAGVKELPGSIGAFKWGGAYATDYFIDPEKDLIFLYYTNIHPFHYYDELFKRCRIMTYAAMVE
ncbi:MAG: serine hydrolase domain-containing protein [Cyclobacteriaceae bacterium]